jgi:hypothetical protein
LSEEAKRLVDDNPHYSSDKLKIAIERAIQAEGLAMRGQADGDARLSVSVLSIRSRSAFAAIMFGVLAGDDHIKGRVDVLGKNNEIIASFDVSSSYAFGGIAGGMEDVRMGWLYDSFAKSTVSQVGKILKHK